MTDVPAPIDVLLRLLTQSANKGRLWLAIGVLGALLPGATRRAAIRGVGSLAATSLLINALVKPLARRKRPLIERTPVVRRLVRQPRTFSFPSGHAASAAAFATGAAMEHPASAAVLVPLGAMVGYSRIHAGVHHVSDVLAGAAMGVGLALATRRWWPVARAEPVLRGADRGGGVAAPRLPAGAGLLILANPKAGAGGDISAPIRELLPGAEIVELPPDVDATAVLAGRLGTARALGVTGGDGTIGALAAVALQQGLPVALFPAGTRNHFAQDVGIRSFADTARAVEAGEAVAVDVATVNGRPFVNTAVVGAYPDLVRQRDAQASRAAWWPATGIAAVRVLRAHRPVRLAINGQPAKVWTLFVGNCRYVSHGTLPATRPRLHDGLLDAGYLRADTPFSRTRAVLSSLARVRERPRAHPRLLVTELAVEAQGGPVEYALDGETGQWAAVLHFGKLPSRLVVYRPLVNG